MKKTGFLRLALAVSLVTALAFVGCGGGGGDDNKDQSGTPSITAITVIGGDNTLLSTQTRTLAVTRTGTGNVTWTSNNDDAVEFSTGNTFSATVTGLTVTMRAKDVTAQTTVVVTASVAGGNAVTETFTINPPPTAESISIAAGSGLTTNEDGEIEIPEGLTRTITIVTVPSPAAVGTVTWESDDVSIVNVTKIDDRSASIEALGAEGDSAVITATSDLAGVEPATVTVVIAELDKFELKGEVPFTWDFKEGAFRNTRTVEEPRNTGWVDMGSSSSTSTANFDANNNITNNIDGIAHNGLVVHGNLHGRGTGWGSSATENTISGTSTGRIEIGGGAVGTWLTLTGMDGPLVVEVDWGQGGAGERGFNINIGGTAFQQRTPSQWHANNPAAAGNNHEAFMAQVIHRDSGDLAPITISNIVGGSLVIYEIRVRRPTDAELTPPTVEEVLISATSNSVDVNSNVTITATVNPVDLDDRTVEWIVTPDSAIVGTPTGTQVTITSATPGDVTVVARSNAVNALDARVDSEMETVVFNALENWQVIATLTFETDSAFGQAVIPRDGEGAPTPEAATIQGTAAWNADGVRGEFSAEIDGIMMSFGGTTPGTWRWVGTTSANSPYGNMQSGGTRSNMIRIPAQDFPVRVEIQYSGTGGTAPTDTRFPTVNGDRDGALAVDNNAIANHRTHTWDVAADQAINISTTLAIQMHRVRIFAVE